MAVPLDLGAADEAVLGRQDEGSVTLRGRLTVSGRRVSACTRCMDVASVGGVDEIRDAALALTGVVVAKVSLTGRRRQGPYSASCRVPRNFVLDGTEDQRKVNQRHY